MFKVSIPGLPALQERFRRMREDELQELMLAEAEDLAQQLQDLYRLDAPAGTTGEFRDSITAAATPTPLGFQIEVSTSQGNVNLWVKEGTGVYGPAGQPITPTTSQVLHFQWLGQDWYVASIAGMASNPWAETVDEQALAYSVAMGGRIGTQVRDRLASA